MLRVYAHGEIAFREGHVAVNVEVDDRAFRVGTIPRLRRNATSEPIGCEQRFERNAIDGHARLRTRRAMLGALGHAPPLAGRRRSATLPSKTAGSRHVR